MYRINVPCVYFSPVKQYGVLDLYLCHALVLEKKDKYLRIGAIEKVSFFSQMTQPSSLSVICLDMPTFYHVLPVWFGTSPDFLVCIPLMEREPVVAEQELALALVVLVSVAYSCIFKRFSSFAPL